MAISVDMSFVITGLTSEGKEKKEHRKLLENKEKGGVYWLFLYMLLFVKQRD
jgi:hypothetical protein